MEIIKINREKLDDNFDAVKAAADILRKNGVVVYPTDTLYALGVNALNKYSVEKLFRIKERKGDKAIPVMIRDLKMAREIAFMDKEHIKILKNVWPGRVTVVLPKRHAIPSVLTGGMQTIGMRIPKNIIAYSIIELLDFPITCTSANISGEDWASNSDLIIKKFRKHYPRPDLILDAGTLPPAEPSTVLDLSGQEAKVLRVGPVKKEELLHILGSGKGKPTK